MLNLPVKSKFAVLSAVLAVILATTSVTSVFAATSAATTTTSNTIDRNLAMLWKNQYWDLQSDRAFLNNFKAHPEDVKNAPSPAEVQQYLDQYAAALSRAEAIMLSGSPSSTSTVKSNSPYERNRTTQQDLAVYLEMIRGLQNKLNGS